ncbi:MAG: helix-turn-helix domain-containing protein [Eubacteriales bacterium]|nr:helix-turn-helix domain-containing protein [Eubacteriales bacterium]
MENKKHVGYEIHTLDNMIGRKVAVLCEKEGLTQMQSWIIGYLYTHPSENIFQKDIEAQFHIARSTATGILQLMEKREFLYREPFSGDARLKRLILTEKGISHHLSIIRDRDRMERILKTGISQEDLDIFMEVIHQMKRNIEKDIS